MFKRLGVFLTLSLFLAVNAYAASCPEMPALCTDEGRNDDGTDICYNYALAPTQMNPQIHTFPEPENNNETIGENRTIYINENTHLTLNGNNSYHGTIINCGWLTLGSNVKFGDGSKLFNYGEMKDSNPTGFAMEQTVQFTNGIYSEIKGEDSAVIKRNGYFEAIKKFSIKGSSTVTNRGEIITHDELFISSNSQLDNYGFIIIKDTKSFVTEGTVNNEGVLEATGFINFNSDAETINDCTFIAGSGFNAEGKTFTNNGYVIISGGDDAKFSKILITGKGSFISGIKFRNDATITGFGSFFFSGDTTNTGSITASADDGLSDFTAMAFNKQFVVGTQLATLLIDTSLVKLDRGARVDSCNDFVKDIVITIKDVTGDNFISLEEVTNAQKTDVSAIPIKVEGTADVEDGIIVTVFILGVEYPAEVTNNEWSIEISTEVLAMFNPLGEKIEAQIKKDDTDPDSFPSNKPFVDLTIEIEQIIQITDIKTESLMEGETVTEKIIVSGTTKNVEAVEEAKFTFTVAGETTIVSDHIEIKSDGSWSVEFLRSDILLIDGEVPIKIELINAADVNDDNKLVFINVQACPMDNQMCQDVTCSANDTCIEVCLENMSACPLVVFPCTELESVACPIIPIQKIQITDIKTVQPMDGEAITEKLIISGTTDNVEAMDEAKFTFTVTGETTIVSDQIEIKSDGSWSVEFPRSDILLIDGEVPIKIELVNAADVNDDNKLVFTNVQTCPIDNQMCQDVTCSDDDTCIEVCLENISACPLVVIPCTELESVACPVTPTPTIQITDIKTVPAVDGGNSTETLIISGSTTNVAAMDEAKFTRDNPEVITDGSVVIQSDKTWSSEFPRSEIIKNVGKRVPVKITLLNDVNVFDNDVLTFTKLDECTADNTCINVCLDEVLSCAVVEFSCDELVDVICPAEPVQTILITDIKTKPSMVDGDDSAILIISGTTTNVAASEKAKFTFTVAGETTALVSDQIMIQSDGSWSVEFPRLDILLAEVNVPITIELVNNENVKDDDSLTFSIKSLDCIEGVTCTEVCLEIGSCVEIDPEFMTEYNPQINITHAIMTDSPDATAIEIDDVDGLKITVDQLGDSAGLTISGTTVDVYDENLSETLGTLSIVGYNIEETITIRPDGTWSYTINHDVLVQIQQNQLTTAGLVKVSALGLDSVEYEGDSIVNILICELDAAGECEGIEAVDEIIVNTNINGVGSVNTVFLILLSLILVSVMMLKMKAYNKELDRV